MWDSQESVTHDLGSLRSLLVGDGASEEKDVWLRSVDHVVDPPWAHLDSNTPPFHLRHQLTLRHHLSHVLGEHDVSDEREEGQMKYQVSSPRPTHLTRHVG